MFKRDSPCRWPKERNCGYDIVNDASYRNTVYAERRHPDDSESQAGRQSTLFLGGDTPVRHRRYFRDAREGEIQVV